MLHCVAATGVTPAIYSVFHSVICTGLLFIIGYGALESIDHEVRLKKLATDSCQSLSIKTDFTV